jgi:hypothetical protein
VGSLITRILRDSEEVLLAVDGQVVGLVKTEGVIYTPHPHPAARVMSMTFSIESDLRVLLFWEHDEDHPDQLILPLEGRGTLDFSKFGGLVNPREEGWSGRVGLRAWSEKGDFIARHFHISLELSKQRN